MKRIGLMLRFKFPVSEDGDKLFDLDGLIARPYVIPDDGTEVRLKRRRSLFLVGVLLIIIGTGISLTFLRPWTEASGRLDLMIVIMAPATWGLYRLLLFPVLKALPRIELQSKQQEDASWKTTTWSLLIFGVAPLWWTG